MKNNSDFIPDSLDESGNEIIRPFCPVCENIMEEITAGNGEVVYLCSRCGAFNRPVFIDTNVIMRC